MEFAVHLPLMQLGDEPLSLRRLQAAADAARDGGFTAISANDHLFFATPWLDGPTALAAVVERSGQMELATTIALVVMRGAVPLAKTLTALDVLSGGRVVAGVGPGSSARDYEAAGIPFDDRWKRFEQAVVSLRAAFSEVAPAPARERGVPIWIGSWGSPAGLRRVARLADGWLASAYNTTPDQFAAARRALEDELRAHGRTEAHLPSALATMWTWITDSRTEA